MKKTTRDYLADNINMLLNYHQWSRAELARKSGVSPRMVAYIATGEKAATIEVAEKLGEAFGITGWLMISPYLSIDTYKNMEKLNSHYSQTTPEGKDHILMVAEREAIFSKAK